MKKILNIDDDSFNQLINCVMELKKGNIVDFGKLFKSKYLLKLCEGDDNTCLTQDLNTAFLVLLNIASGKLNLEIENKYHISRKFGIEIKKFISKKKH